MESLFAVNSAVRGSELRAQVSVALGIDSLRGLSVCPTGLARSRDHALTNTVGAFAKKWKTRPSPTGLVQEERQGWRTT